MLFLPAVQFVKYIFGFSEHKQYFQIFLLKRLYKDGSKGVQYKLQICSSENLVAVINY